MRKLNRYVILWLKVDFWKNLWICTMYIPIQKFIFTTQCGNFRNFPPLEIFFRQIDLQYNSLVKTLIWRNFLQKIVGEKFSNYHTTVCTISWQNFVKAITSSKLSYFSVDFTNLSWNEREFTHFSSLCRNYLSKKW